MKEGYRGFRESHFPSKCTLEVAWGRFFDRPKKGSPQETPGVRARRPATECRSQAACPSSEQSGEESNGRGTAVPLPWSFQGGVQRGEIEIPPLAVSWGVRGAILCRSKNSPPAHPVIGETPPPIAIHPKREPKHKHKRGDFLCPQPVWDASMKKYSGLLPN